MNLEITVIRIDPAKKAIARIRKPFKRNATRIVAGLVGAKAVNARMLMLIDEVRLTNINKLGQPYDGGPTPLVVASGVDAEEGGDEWRLRGSEDTAGIGLMFGQGIGGGMVDCPVSAEWVRKRIVWIPAEDEAGLLRRAEAMVPSIPPEIREALIAAEDAGPFHDADTTMVMAASAEPYAQAAIALGVTTEVSGGRGLTKLGAAARDIIMAEIRA